MARNTTTSPRHRGTRILSGDGHEATERRKPWWRGVAVAGGSFAALLVLAIALTMTEGDKGSDGASAPAMPALTPTTPPARIGTDAGGDPRTSAHKVVDGVPVGYAHSEAGAIQAAVNYQIARSSATYFTDTATRHKVIDAMATRESREKLTSNDDTGIKQVLVSLGIHDGNHDTLVARSAAMGTKVDSYADQVATVEVWMAGLIGTTDKSAPLPVSASWTTYTLTLQWQDGDWKLASVNSVNGPTPLDTGSDHPSSVDDFRTADQEFHAPPYVG